MAGNESKPTNNCIPTHRQVT